MLRMREKGTHTLHFFFICSTIKRLVHFVKIYSVLMYKLCLSHTNTHCYTSVGTQTSELTPHRITHPLRCTLTVPRPSLALPRSHPLSSLLLFSCLFRGMWLAGCVRRPDSKSVTHSLSKFPFFFLPGFAHLQQLYAKRSVYSSHTDTHTL